MFCCKAVLGPYHIKVSGLVFRGWVVLGSYHIKVSGVLSGVHVLWLDGCRTLKLPHQSKLCSVWGSCSVLGGFMFCGWGSRSVVER